MIERSYSDLNLVDVESPKALARTIRALDEAVVAAVYTTWFGPGDDVRTGAVSAIADPFAVVVFPPGIGSTNRLAYNSRVPEVWRGGVVKAALYYSGSASSSASIDWRLTSESIAVGEIMAAAVTNQNVTAAGPGTVNKVASTTFSPLTVPIASGDRILAVRLYRNTGDAYTGDAYFLGMLLQFFPAKTST